MASTLNPGKTGGFPTTSKPPVLLKIFVAFKAFSDVVTPSKSVGCHG
jgi:hypothetical protein